jgi:4-hydroxy-2-oxovalerate aldolase
MPTNYTLGKYDMENVSGPVSARSFPRPSESRVEILECTLRDGSYAVDFKFTERDTAVLAGVLSRLGFKWIEVGHGLGLGAAQAGKGTMPTTDECLIESAKRAAPDALIGSFFIPGIGSKEQLRSARDAGLDFVRIGYSAPEIEEAYPYVEFAKQVGLITCLNFMKTYGVTAQEFGEKSKDGVAAGADVVYCVDSAGSMFPEDVRRYLGEALERCGATLGFHGHSNLQFAVANSLEAYRCGARMVDATLYGLGRSAGNVPTEVAVAMFSRLGVATGVNLFEVMDAAEEFMGPLMSQMQLYDMMSVAMGYSQFHSSFLPRVSAAAHKHGVDLRRLVVAMGNLDPVHLDAAALERVAEGLPKTKASKPREALTSFCARGISKHNISASLSAVKSLVDGMVVTCAKRRARPALELVAAKSPSSDLVLADFVLTDDTMVLGRVTYGSFETLEQVFAITTDAVSFYLIDLDGGSWGTSLPERLKHIVGPQRVIPIRSRRLYESYVEEVLMCAAQQYGDFCLLVYGNPDFSMLKRYCENFRNVVVHGVLPPDSPPNSWQISDFSDRVHFDLGIGVTMLLCPPDFGDAVAIDQLTLPDGVLITAGYFPLLERDLPDRVILRLDPNQASRGQLARWVALSTLMKPANARLVGAQ